MSINFFLVYSKLHVVGLNITKFQQESLQINSHLMNNMVIVNMPYVLLMKQENIGKNQQVVKQKLRKKFVQLSIQHLTIVEQLKKMMQKKLLKLMKNIKKNPLKLIHLFINLPMFVMKKIEQQKKKNSKNLVIIINEYLHY